MSRRTNPVATDRPICYRIRCPLPAPRTPLMKGLRLLFLPLFGPSFLALALRAAEPAGAPAPEHGFLSRTFKGTDGREYRYPLTIRLI